MAENDYSWIGPVVQAAGSFLGSQQKQEGMAQQNKLLEDAYLRALAMLESGQLGYTPTTAEGIRRPVGDQGASAAQQDALYRLQEAAREGYSVTDKAAINAAVNQANQNERGQREAILSRLDPRSGAALAAQMQAQQSGANRASQQAMDIAAGSRAKALASLGAYGNLASNMRNREFDEQNAIDQFNANIGRFNVGQINDARSRGVGNKLSALQLAGGAGGALGQGLAGAGTERGAQTAGLGSSLGGVANLWSNERKSEPSTNSNNGLKITNKYDDEGNLITSV